MGDFAKIGSGIVARVRDFVCAYIQRHLVVGALAFVPFQPRLFIHSPCARHPAPKIFCPNAPATLWLPTILVGIRHLYLTRGTISSASSPLLVSTFPTSR